jgi:hypothetical protein
MFELPILNNMHAANFSNENLNNWKWKLNRNVDILDGMGSWELVKPICSTKTDFTFFSYYGF